MAIDTAEKRRAVAAFALLFLAPGITPDATRDAEWRIEALWSYPMVVVAAVTDLAGATIHPAHLRLVAQARTRSFAHARTGTTSPARLRRPEPAQTGRTD